MFKSRIPLQTPIKIKFLLFASLMTLFISWSASSEAANNSTNENLLITRNVEKL